MLLQLSLESRIYTVVIQMYRITNTDCFGMSLSSRLGLRGTRAEDVHKHVYMYMYVHMYVSLFGTS